MKQLIAIGAKLIAHVLLALVIFTLIYDAPAMDSIIAAVIVAVAIYVVGDMFVLRKYGNIVATVVDAGSSFLIAWLYFNASLDDDFLIPSLIFGALAGVFEYFFHIWLLRDDVVSDDRARK